jgi:phosphotransferase system enzyme I (PtsI)
MGSGALAAVGASVASVTLDECRARAAAACDAPDPVAARQAAL